MVKDVYVFDGEPRAISNEYIPYLDEMVQRVPIVSAEYRASVPPHMKATVTGKIIFQKIVATYLLDIEGTYTGTLQTIKGKITKTEPQDHCSEIVLEDL